MSGLHHRDVGGVGAMLLSEDVDCEVICDGLHLSPEYLDILFRVKDTSRFMMISDSNYIAGAKPGRYRNTSGLETIMDEEGVNRDIDGRISGSTKSVLYGMKVLNKKLNMPMETIVRMSSFNAAKKYGFTAKGSLSVGKDADFVVIDDDFNAVCTCVEGEIVHRRDNPNVQYNPFYVKLFNM
jgi:N-acetylglucosamine-6-phosphate deacetylase